MNSIKFLLFMLPMVFGDGVSTHVLDTAIGQPGRGVNLNVYHQAADGSVQDNRWVLLRSL